MSLMPSELFSEMKFNSTETNISEEIKKFYLYKEIFEKIVNRKSVKCSFCGCMYAGDSSHIKYVEINIETADIIKDIEEHIEDGSFVRIHPHSYLQTELSDDYIIIEFFRCKSCNNTTIKVHYPFLNQVIGIHPQFNEPVLPDYIPQSIKQDYKEACMIAELSPRAAAILLRRCLQEMLRDLTGKRQNLYEEINNFALKTNTDITILDALNATRQIGNIGAHPEANIDNIIDISCEEAEVLLKFIMHFIEEWYIRPHDVEETANELIRINNEKQKQKKQT